MKLIRLPEVLDRVGLKKTAVYKMMAEEEFPRPVKIGTSSALRAGITAGISAGAPKGVQGSGNGNCGDGVRHGQCHQADQHKDPA